MTSSRSTATEVLLHTAGRSCENCSRPDRPCDGSMYASHWIFMSSSRRHRVPDRPFFAKLFQIWSHGQNILLKRVPGLPIRDCGRSSNNLMPKNAKVNAIDVTTKLISEHLVLVPGQAGTCPLSPCPRRPHPHRSLTAGISRNTQSY